MGGVNSIYPVLYRILLTFVKLAKSLTSQLGNRVKYNEGFFEYGVYNATLTLGRLCVPIH